MASENHAMNNDNDDIDILGGEVDPGSQFNASSCSSSDASTIVVAVQVCNLDEGWLLVPQPPNNNYNPTTNSVSVAQLSTDEDDDFVHVQYSYVTNFLKSVTSVEPVTASEYDGETRLCSGLDSGACNFDCSTELTASTVSECTESAPSETYKMVLPGSSPIITNLVNSHLQLLQQSGPDDADVNTYQELNSYFVIEGT